MSNQKFLIVYYSRTGTTRKIANDLRDILRCDIEEIVDKVNRKGILGYIKSGYGAVRGISSPIENIIKDVSHYDLVVIGTPVWGGHTSCAVRTFINKNRSKIKAVAFFSTQMGEAEDKVFEDLKRLSGYEPKATLRLSGKQIKNNNHQQDLLRFVEDLNK